jgi:phage terminase large subunit-like protein
LASVADQVDAYAKAVLAKREPAGAPVRQACARHVADRKRKDLVWDGEKAARAIAFFPVMLTLEGGRPFELEPFQKFIVGSVFGWYNRDGTRRFRTAYVETAKGSGKTPLAAGIGLYGLVADGEPAAEIYSAATARDQASIVFRDAKRMVEASPELRELVHDQVGSLSIPAEHSVFRPVSAEHRGLDGKRVHIALVDELHEHPSAIVLDKMRAGTKSRPNALIFIITNSGYDRSSVCYRQHEYSRKVLSGALKDDSLFAYVAALDEKDDWRNPKVWPKANPGLGKILPVRYLEEQVREAVGMPAKEALVRRLNFCQWTESHSVFIPDDVWMANGDAAGPAETWIAAVDLGFADDLSAAAFVGQDDEGRWGVKMRFWAAEATIRRRRAEGRYPYHLWVEQGFITVTPGEVTDYDQIERDLLEECESLGVAEIAYDRFMANQLMSHLRDALGEERVIPFGQGFVSMSAPTKELLRLAADRKIRHGGNPVLRWMNANVQIRQDPAGNLKMDKGASAEKIDGMVALAMALGRAMVRQAGPVVQPSIYEERGALVF